MATIRTGDSVCLIMSMNVRGTVIEVFEKEHRTMMVDGPLGKSTYARVQVNKGPLGTPPIIECRLGDLMHHDG